MKNIVLVTFLLISVSVSAQEKLDYMDVFEIEWISDPQISPDGRQVLYVRNFSDVTTDQHFSNVWIVQVDGSANRPMTTGNQKDFSPRWSPDGKRILYKSTKDGSVQLYLRWMDTGAEQKLTNLKKPFGSPKWSPDGRQIAFSMFIEDQPVPLVQLPSPPKNATWAPVPKYIDQMNYRADGEGYLQEGFGQLFLLSPDGGTPRQLTTGKFHHGGDFSWSNDSQSILLSANRHENGELDPVNSEIYVLSIHNQSILPITSRQGPDFSPRVSPDGKSIAYLGFEDRYQGYQLTNLYIMNSDGSSSRQVIKTLDRDIENIQWSTDGKGIYFQYDDKGNTWIAFTDLQGNVSNLANHVGGLTLDRPYGGGQFTVASTGHYAFTHSTPDHPADLATGQKQNSTITRITHVNQDLFQQKPPGKVEEIWYTSSYDNRNIQGWLIYPPDFDASKKYPFILEIHGGPFANYGSRYTTELQLFAAKGYIVLYANPRGSTSYGEEFGNLIHHNYPNQDYDDLMSGVDAVIAKGNVDPQNLFVTGGSGGGVLTAWIVGHTTRFKAAVVAKPVINWYSFVLYSDVPAFFYKYWFPGMPWDHVEHYMKRSPISYVKNVKTPTMLLTGEQDYRTPISESEQYYAALKLNQVETALVRIQEASHGIADKPSNQINKAGYILGWFEKYRMAK